MFEHSLEERCHEFAKRSSGIMESWDLEFLIWNFL